ncbi:MAG: hypothetical protein IPK68_20725 [Bdellovibrionales bacterium]|nr:hypothetical protein [Bdellovibrionales bacterium]
MEDRLGQLESQKKEKAKEFLGGILTDLKHEKFQPIQSYLYNVYLHFKDPEIQGALKTNGRLYATKEMGFRHFGNETLMIAGSQDSELSDLLKEVKVNLLRLRESMGGF